jgi:NitT/TauT family transport system substrate-binding protein
MKTFPNGICVAAALVVGASAIALPASAQDTLKVAIGQINNWENQPPTLGQDHGIFKKYNLTLENFGTAGAGETVQTVISGSADIGGGVGLGGALRAFSKGAPVRVLLPSYTGTSDLYWYVKADSPIKTLKDATEKNTIAYSTNGSSSNNIVIAFVEELGTKARPTATGGLPATLTSVMSGQIDIGWGAPPFGVKELNEGKIRIIARGSDIPSLRGQTVRAIIVNANSLKNKKDAMIRFAKGFREAVDWMYDDPAAITTYAKKINTDEAIVKQSIRDYQTRAALQTDELKDFDGAMRDAVKLKFLDKVLTPDQVKEFVQIPPK